MRRLKLRPMRFCDPPQSLLSVSIDAVARLLEEGRIVKSIRQVEKCIPDSPVDWPP